MIFISLMASALYSLKSKVEGHCGGVIPQRIDNTTSSDIVYLLTTPIPKGGENATVDQIKKRSKWENDDYVCRGLILNGMSDPLFDIYQNVESSQELCDSLEAKYMAEDASSKNSLFTQHKMKMDEAIQDSDKPKGNNVVGPSIVNMVEHNNSFRYNDNKGKRKHQDTKVDPNKKSKVTCWKCGKPGHLKKDCKGGKVDNKANGSSTNGSVNGFFNLLKDAGRCWFKTYKSLNDGYILYMGNESTTLVHGHGCVDLRFSSGKIVSFFNVLHVLNIRKNLVSSSILNIVVINKLNIVNNKIGLAFMSTIKLNDSILWHVRLGHVHFKRMQDIFKDGLILAFDMDTEKYKTCILTKITKKLFQIVKCKTKVLELIHSDLCDLHATSSLGNKIYFVAFIDDASRAVVRLPDPKLKTLDERGIECIFVRYVKHYKAFRLSSVPGPSQTFLINETEDIGGSVAPKEVVIQQPEPKLRKNKRNRTPKKFGPEFQLYLTKGTRDEVSNQYSYCFNVEDDLKIFDEAMKSQDVAFWKEAINDEMDSILGNNTWVLVDLPPVARISTIRLLIALTSIHNLIIHQMDVKTSFLNSELEEEVYMNQPQGFIMHGNENKMCKLIKSLYRLKQAPKQWHQKFDEVVLSSGYLLNQADKCVYSKLDEFGKGVIICLYVDDMLIFGTNQVQVDLTKEFLSSKFSIKDIGEADVILVSTPMDTSEKLIPNNDQAVSQLKCFRVIGCQMYVMTCTRPDIAFVVGKLSRYTRNPGTQHWQAIQMASKKQTCITSLIMESEFVALAATGKKAECDATLAKAYSQMYNGKSRHLGVKHNMIHELIMNGVVSIEFVRPQQNLVDYLTKELARDLVIKMCLEPSEKEDEDFTSQ
ncbi:zinc finger, CCHC-type containing protein [Tanacetum coccineum]